MFEMRPYPTSRIAQRSIRLRSAIPSGPPTRCPATAPAPMSPQIAPDAPPETTGTRQFHASDAAEPPSPASRYMSKNRQRP